VRGVVIHGRHDGRMQLLDCQYDTNYFCVEN
jgi:hypothetical protein